MIKAHCVLWILVAALPLAVAEPISPDPVEAALGHWRPCGLAPADLPKHCGTATSDLLFIDADSAEHYAGIVKQRLHVEKRSVLFKSLSLEALRSLLAGVPAMPSTPQDYTLVQPLPNPKHDGEHGWGVVQLGRATDVRKHAAVDSMGNVYDLTNTSHGTSKYIKSKQRFLSEVQQHVSCEVNGDKKRCFSLYSADPDQGMIPSAKGACYSYFFLKATGPFMDDADLNSVTNLNWYTYAIANPATKLLEAIQIYVVAHGLHASVPLMMPDTTGNLAVGWYKAGSVVNLQAKPVSGQNSEMTWTYTQPATQNVPHVSGQTTSNTNSNTEGISLGFSGSGLSGGLSFSSTQSTSIGYSVQTTITDWSVYEQSDGLPSPGFGQWQYDETWPVNNNNDNADNFGSSWQSFYSPEWCGVKTPPALSTQSQQTSSSIMWRADLGLLASNLTMWIDFYFQMEFEMYRLWCPTSSCFSGACNPCGSSHHCLVHVLPYYPAGWKIDAAALNNLKTSELLNVIV